MFEALLEHLSEHDGSLAAAAFALGLVNSFAVIACIRRALDVKSGKLGWIAASSIVAGLGSWSTSFVFLLAFTPPVSVEFDLARLMVSLGASLAACSLSIVYLVRSQIRHAALVAGALGGVGLFIAAMLMLGAMQGPAGFGFNRDILSLGMSVGTPLITLGAFGVRHLRGRWGTALTAFSYLMGCAIFLEAGLTALTFPDAALALSKPTSPSYLLAVVTMLGVLPVAGIGLAAAIFDRHIGEQRKTAEERMRALANATSEGMALEREGIILEVNNRFVELTGLAREDLIGAPICKVGQDPESVETIRAIDDGEQHSCRMRSKAGPVISAQLTCQTLDLQGGKARMLAFRDVSSEERARARIMHMAHHDPLTGLPNRLCFREKLEAELKRSWEEHTLVALMFFDLDRFKEVNDVHGHAAGDDLLVAVAGRMLDSLPKGAVAARLSGDEFAVVLPDIDSRLDAITIAQRVVDNVGSPITLGKVHMNVSASGGVTLFPLDGEDMDRLMNQADQALYRAKHQGRNCVCDFDPSMGREMQARHELESDLAVAIEDEMLDLHFQPQAMLGTGEVIGFEALVRWEDEKRGFVPPSEFIQLAEETGQILKLGRWVIERACREAVNWPENMRVSVNVSPAQFRQGNVVLTIERALKATGLDPRRLEIEITEGVLIDDESRALTLLRRLKQLGVGLAIDDFGTGYASLNYLRAFPFDKIKIDRAFVSGIQNQPEAQIIVHSTIDLARKLGMEIVVEGIEELDELMALGDQPDLVLQGYLLSRPMTRGQIPAFLDSVPDYLIEMAEINARRIS